MIGMRQLLLFSAGISCVALAAPALSQGSGGIEDIIVTARRTTESMQRIPVAVTAMTADTLAQMNALQVDSIARVTPNLSIAQLPTAAGGASVTIRGIGQTDPGMIFDMAVGIYVDGVYMARTSGAIFDLVDPERVEVLRGPQGTLFGRNSTGGALNIISKKPAEELGLSVEAGYGSRHSWRAKARFDTGKMGGGPLSAAFTFQHRQRDGYFDNKYTPGIHDPGSLIVNAFRAQLRGDFGAFRFDYSFDFSDRKGGENYFQLVALTEDAHKYYGNSPNLGGAPITWAPASHRIWEGSRPPSPLTRPGYSPFLSTTRSWGHTLNLAFEVSPALALESITGYRGMEANNAFNFSGSDVLRGVVLDPVTFAPSVGQVYLFSGFEGPLKQHQFSEELKLSGSAGDLKYVAGAYYFWENPQSTTAQMLTAVLPGGDVALNLAPVIGYTSSTQSYAAYGQASYRPSALGQKLEVTAGLRYTHDGKKVHLMAEPAIVGPAAGRVTFSNVSWLGSLGYDFTDSVMAYAKVSTGYQSGGFNGRATSLNAFEPQKVLSVEAGIKSDLWNRRLRFNLAGYWMRYKNLQIQQFAPGTSGATSIAVNAGRATFRGLEAELTAIPLRGLMISGSIGYNHAKYNEFLFRDPETDQIIDIARTARMQMSPKLTSSVAVDYTIPAGRYGQIRAHIDWAHRSKLFFYPNDNINIFNQEISSPAQDTLSARLALSDIPLAGRATGEIALTGENLTNQDQVSYGVDLGALGFAGIVYGEPRRFGIQFRVVY